MSSNFFFLFQPAIQQLRRNLCTKYFVFLFFLQEIQFLTSLSTVNSIQLNRFFVQVTLNAKDFKLTMQLSWDCCFFCFFFFFFQAWNLDLTLYTSNRSFYIKTSNNKIKMNDNDERNNYESCNVHIDTLLNALKLQFKRWFI